MIATCRFSGPALLILYGAAQSSGSGTRARLNDMAAAKTECNTWPIRYGVHMPYQELNIEERVTMQVVQLQGLSQRAIARMLDRSHSVISRELRRNAAAASA